MMYGGVQQQVQPTPLPPPCFRPTPPPPPPPSSYGPGPPPPPFQPCGGGGPLQTTTPPRPFPTQPPVVTASRPYPAAEPPRCPPPQAPSVVVAPRCRQNRPAPLPLQGQAFPEPPLAPSSSTPPFQDTCCPPPQVANGGGGGGGSVVYQRVRTYSSPGGAKFSSCSARAPSPFEGGSPGYQRVVWSSDPPLQQDVSSPSLKLTPYSQGSIRRIILENPDQEPLSPLLRGGNNVIYEKTIRKYELLNPDQEKQYQYALQHTQPDQCHISPPQPVDHVQVTQQQCQHTQMGNCYDIGPVSVNDAGRGTVKRVIIQPCEPVPCVQQTNDQLDSRYFGELLAELHHKSVELHNCLLLHVEKLGGRPFEIESFESAEDIESLIPKGLSELTKQQIRYLLEMRVTANKSLKLVLATFSNLREELVHLQDDLGKLESDKMLLEKDLAFKESQVKEYETLLASVRENNRQQQQALREYTLKCRSLEEQLLSLRLNDGERDFRLKDLEYSKRALEQEIQNLKLQASSNPLGQTTTDELSSRYVEMINQLREDKDREIRNLRSQVCQFQTDFSKKQGTDIDLQMKLQELNFRLEEKEAYIKQQEEELFRLKQEKLAINPSQGITKTIITKRYRNQYPILGLLSDDYKATSPVKESQTIVIEKTGERWKQESFTTD